MLCYAKSLQSCPTLCDPKDGSPPGSPVPRILQARTLEWVAISFSSAWKWKVKVKSLSRVPLLATPWTAAHQAPPSMGFSRQEYWSGVPLPSRCSYLRGQSYSEIIHTGFSPSIQNWKWVRRNGIYLQKSTALIQRLNRGKGIKKREESGYKLEFLGRCWHGRWGLTLALKKE